MAEQKKQTQRRHRAHDNPPRETGHALVAVEETLPGKEPTQYDVDLTEGPPYTYRARYRRCRCCGQERNCRAE